MRLLISTVAGGELRPLAGCLDPHLAQGRTLEGDADPIVEDVATEIDRAILAFDKTGRRDLMRHPVGVPEFRPGFEDDVGILPRLLRNPQRIIIREHPHRVRDSPLPRGKVGGPCHEGQGDDLLANVCRQVPSACP